MLDLRNLPHQTSHTREQVDDLQPLLEVRHDGVGGHVAPMRVVVVAVVAGRGRVSAAPRMGSVARVVSRLYIETVWESNSGKVWKYSRDPPRPDLVDRGSAVPLEPLSGLMV